MNAAGAPSANSSSAFPLSPTWAEFVSYETYIFDCDGVIWGIDEVDTPLSVATINHLLELGKRVMFVTNNSNKRRADFVLELERRGVTFHNMTEEQKLDTMISASFTTARYLAANGLRRPFVITSDTGLLEELRLAGVEDFFATVGDDGMPQEAFAGTAMHGDEPSVADIIKSRPDVDCIVIGWDTCIHAKKVATAVNYIRWHDDLHGTSPGHNQLPIIACAGDASGVFGTATHAGKTLKIRAIGNGAMADFVARCFDPPRPWLDMGKPSDALLTLLGSPAGYGVDLSKALMVGDTLQTDIVFGNRGGMASLLVFSGVTTEEELVADLVNEDPLRRPTYVLDKLGHWAQFGRLPPESTST